MDFQYGTTISTNFNFERNWTNYNYNNLSINANILCTGHDSCRYLILRDSNNVYCMGYGSCCYAIIKFVVNVFLYAIASGNQATIFDIKHNVYCTSRWACWGGIINNVGGNIYGYGHEAMEYGNIHNVHGSVIGLGSTTLSSSTISHVKNVC